MEKKYKIGFVLSGGGARGIAHIGVLKAFEEHGIVPECLAGTSAGAIVSALYAAGKTPEEILNFVRETGSFMKAYKIGIPSMGLTNFTYLKNHLKQQIEKDSFDDLNIPTYIAICNLHTGEVEIRHSGILFDVVVASCSIPMIFQPTQIGDNKFVDGGVLMNLPAEALYPICETVIGVNVMPHYRVTDESMSSFIDLAIRASELSIQGNTEPQLSLCDVVIEPIELYKYNIFNFSNYQEIYDIGYQAALDKIDEVKAAIEAEHPGWKAII